MSDESGATASRWLRRENRRRAGQERMKKHGGSLRRVYGDAIRKRLAKRRKV